jgi:hypothetical protein
LREERTLRVFENKVLRRVLGPKRDAVTGEWRKLHNEEIASQLHTTTSSTTRQTPHAALNSLVLLMMGIMMPEIC